MRESPLALQGSAEVPMPLEPSGQSSRGLGGAGGGAGGGVLDATAATLALGAGAGSSFFGSSLQPKRSAAHERINGSVDERTVNAMGRHPARTRRISHALRVRSRRGALSRGSLAHS